MAPHRVTWLPALVLVGCISLIGAAACSAPSDTDPSTGPTTGSGGSSTAGSGGQSSAGSAGASGAGGGSLSGGAGGLASSGGASGGTATGGAAGVGGSSGGGGSGGAGGSGGVDPSACQVGAVPDALREEWDVDPWYQKYADANGIPVLTSNAPSDEAIVLTCQLVIEMVSERDDVRQALIDNHVHFTIIGVTEQTNEVPEYSYLDDSINQRARGLGGNPGMCSEEGILCHAEDLWKGESICVHEFGHTISIYGLYEADPTFEDRLIDAYEAAQSAGRFANTYAMENEQEYWGEAVQDWYYTNLESEPPNGVHGPIDKREELLEYDPVLYELVDELLPADVSWNDCYRDG